MLPRRTLLTLPAAALAQAPGAGLLADVEKYVAFGEHRTATPADRETGAWLHARLKAAGFAANFHPWNLDQFFLDACSLEAGGRKLDAFPLWLPAAANLEVPLAIYTPEGKDYTGKGVLFGRDPATAPRPMGKWIAESGVAATIAATAGTQVVAQNAVPFQPQRIPRVLLAAPDAAALAQAPPALVRIRIAGKLETNVAARNVYGILRRGPRWIAVSTPYSGWFGCGGERGSGLAVWLALAQWASASDLPHSFLFVANSGHELDYLGAAKFFASGLAPKPAETAVWLHLGANAAVRAWEQGEPTSRKDAGSSTADEALFPAVRAAFAGVANHQIRAGAGPGELKNVQEHGYRAFGVIGRNQWGHTRRDGSDATTSAILAQVLEACRAALETIGRK